VTPKEMRKKAIALMACEKFHCSQAVAAAGQEKLGRGHEEVIRAMGAFGGGLGGNGEVCGALAGGLAVFGLHYSRARGDEKENPKMWADTRELTRRFRDEIVNRGGTINCRDIAGVDWNDRDAVKAFYQGDQVKTCIRIVGETALLVGEMLERK